MDCLLGVDIMTDCQYSHGESLVVAKDGTIYAIAQHGYKDGIISYKREQMVHMKKMKHVYGMVLSVR